MFEQMKKQKTLTIIVGCFFTLLTLTQPNTAIGQTADNVQDYRGTTIDKIKATNKIIIGNRPTSVPISYYDNNKKPVGYAIDICLNIVEQLKMTYNLPNLNVQYTEVSGDTRIPYVREGKVDLECGSTTNNAERRKVVDFSIPYYIAGIRILVKNTSNIHNLNDLRGKRISVGQGTTTVDLINKINKDRVMGLTIIPEKDFSTAFNDVVQNRSDAFILDDLLLFGERSKVSNPQDYSVVGEFLSVEPLTIMIRKNDPQFKDFVDKVMLNLINSGQINRLYKKWFESPITPNNQNLNIPQSPLLKDVFRMPTDVVGN